MTAKTIGHYRPGTDSRNDTGYYELPEGIPVPDGFERRPLPSVTTVLDLVGDFSHAKEWWTAAYVNELAQAAKDKQHVRIWHKHEKRMVEVLPGQVLLNMLPGDFGTNAGLHWMKSAGSRELERRANRGQVVHDAVLDFVLRDVRLRRDELADYTGHLIEARGYALTADYVQSHLWNALAWLDTHLDEAYLCECMVVNWTYGWAGTVDMVATLRGDDMPAGQLVQVDFKTSKTWYPEHRLQAATYKHAESCVLRAYEGSDVAVHDYPTPRHLINVYVGEEGVKPMQWGGKDDLFGPDDTLADSYAAFLHLLAVFHHQARARGMSPTTCSSLCMAAPTTEQLDAYRTRHLRKETENHEPTNLVLAEGGQA
jgi:hypothetical protein